MPTCARILNHVLPVSCGNRMFPRMSETVLDVKGMNCPLPVLKANRTLRGMAPGARLRVLATDRAAVKPAMPCWPPARTPAYSAF
jgi:TusA-related sulfurtransferase